VLSGVAHAAVTVTTEEQALLGRLDRDELIKARTEAEAILARDPNSFVATWAMARVHHDEEGNHARALFYVRRAEELLTNRLGGDPTWHKKVLLEEYDIVFEMNRNEEALRVLDRYDALYGPGNQELRIWPLFKLGRPDEARAIATKLAGSDDWDDRRAATTACCRSSSRRTTARPPTAGRSKGCAARRSGAAPSCATRPASPTRASGCARPRTLPAAPTAPRSTTAPTRATTSSPGSTSSRASSRRRSRPSTS
jgi:hypothetical protein